MKAIIYCRKSTDRSDRQQLSIESQEEEARKLALREWLEVVKIFYESKSAKAPGRPLFNEMMWMFNSGKADCIITWKLNRLARNPIDEWTIKWSIQNGMIKAIYTSDEVFKTGDNVLIMWMHFWMSTQYILDLKKDSKRWVERKISQWWVCQKAPLWYINDRLNKTIIVDPVKSLRVKEIFELRCQKMAYTSIGKILYDRWIKDHRWRVFSKSTLENMILNKFYIWLVKHNDTYYKWNYELFISKETFDKANNIYRWMYEYSNKWVKYPLKWFLKDNAWNLMTAFTKKWHIYYWSQNYSSVKVNINERIVFEKAGQILKTYEMDEKFKDFNRNLALKLLENNKDSELSQIKHYDNEISKLKERKTNLLDLRLEWEIDKNVYNEKCNEIVFKINELEIKKNEILNRKDVKKINQIIELGCSLYKSYEQGDDDFKARFLKKIIIELFINKEKELSFAENSSLKLIKFLNFSFGGVNGNWTHIRGVADPCITTLPWHQSSIFKAFRLYKKVF